MSNIGKSIDDIKDTAIQEYSPITQTAYRKNEHTQRLSVDQQDFEIKATRTAPYATT